MCMPTSPTFIQRYDNKGTEETREKVENKKKEERKEREEIVREE